MAVLAVALLLVVGGGIGKVFATGATHSRKVAVNAGQTSSKPGTAPTASVPSCPPDSVLASVTAGLGPSSTSAAQLAAVSSLRQTRSDSPGEQCTVISVLAAFIRQASPVSNNYTPVTPVVQAALTALADRNPLYDDGEVIDLHDTSLAAANLVDANFADADLSGTNGADLTDADLSGANLSGANLANAYLGGANIFNADLTGADLTDASLYGTPLCSASNVPVHSGEDYNCTG